MRLLRLEENNKLGLVEFTGGNIPPYAILSHTWSTNDEDEVRLAELNTEKGREKLGYAKIVRCGEQAAIDGLQYFWCDTCCIDKTSSSELSEAINSMWRWYGDAKICYVYLADVGFPSDTQLAQSRWFKRGWTLQELLAPRDVAFFDSSWEPMGTRLDLAETISTFTKIEVMYLRQPFLIEIASVAQKMSWASRRETTRTEDMAYCLLGIFGINMPLLYGEGDRAFYRLQRMILKDSVDRSILAWTIPSFNKESPLLAQSPADFRECGNISRSHAEISDNMTSYDITNLGLHIKLPLLMFKDGLLAGLNCGPKNTDAMFAIPLFPTVKNATRRQYERGTGPPHLVSRKYWNLAKWRSIYIALEPDMRSWRIPPRPQEGSFVLQYLPRATFVSAVYPESTWQSESSEILADEVSFPLPVHQDDASGVYQSEDRRAELRDQRFFLLSGQSKCLVVLYKEKVEASSREWYTKAHVFRAPTVEAEDLPVLFDRWKVNGMETFRFCEDGSAIFTVHSCQKNIRGSRVAAMAIVDETSVLTKAKSPTFWDRLPLVLFKLNVNASRFDKRSADISRLVVFIVVLGVLQGLGYLTSTQTLTIWGILTGARFWLIYQENSMWRNMINAQAIELGIDEERQKALLAR